MKHYVIGDLQGCREELELLLEKIHFHPKKDRLIIAGDIVNRGNDSLGTLKLLYKLSIKHDCVQSVLGNHDLHLLATAYGIRDRSDKDNFHNIITDKKGTELLEWLRYCPLLIDLPDLNSVVTHAGIPHIWSLKKAKRLAKEVEEVLQTKPRKYLKHIYGTQPDRWHKSLEDGERWRCITNYLTRMRFISDDGTLDFTNKLGFDNAPDNYAPWFAYENPKCNRILLFGHWAALMGDNHGYDDIIPLDTGCVWGGSLTAYCIETGKFTSQKSKQ